MSPATLQAQLEREAVERTLYEVEHVYSRLRIVYELLLLRRLHAACRHRDSSGLPDWRHIRRALDRIPLPEDAASWDALARAGVAPDPFSKGS